MRTKTRNTVLGGILTFVMVFAFALVLLPMTTMTAYAEREREIPAVDSGNSLNMSITVTPIAVMWISTTRTMMRLILLR